MAIGPEEHNRGPRCGGDYEASRVRYQHVAIITVISSSRSLRGAFRAQFCGRRRTAPTAPTELRLEDSRGHWGSCHVSGRMPLGGVAAEACGRAGPHLTGCSPGPGLQNGRPTLF